MARDDDDPFAPPKRKPVHEIGQSLDALSIDELDERAASLRAEIDRIESVKAAKQASRSAADSFFK